MKKPVKNVLFQTEGPDRMTDSEREFMEFLNTISPEQEPDPAEQPNPTTPRAKARLKISTKGGGSHDNLPTRKGDNAP